MWMICWLKVISLYQIDDLKDTFATLCQYWMKLNLAKCAFGVTSGNLEKIQAMQR